MKETDEMTAIFDLLGLLFRGIVVEFTSMYANTFMKPTNVFIQLFLLFFLYLLIQVAMHYLPLIDKIIKFVIYPFSLLHLHVHVRVAVYLSQRRMRQYQSWRDLALLNGLALPHELQAELLERTHVRPMIGWMHGKYGESTRLFLRAGNYTDTFLVAFSPALVALVFFIVIIPIRMIFLAHATDEVTRTLIHAYFSLAVFGGLMPSLDDFKMVSYAGMRDRRTPLWVVIGTVFLGVQAALVIFVAFNDMLVAIIIGTLTTLVSQAFFVMWEALTTIGFHVVTRARYLLRGDQIPEETLDQFVVLGRSNANGNVGVQAARELAPTSLVDNASVIMMDPHEDDDWWDHHG